VRSCLKNRGGLRVGFRLRGGTPITDERPMLEDLASGHWAVIGVSVKRLCFHKYSKPKFRMDFPRFHKCNTYFQYFEVFFNNYILISNTS
jgi:hypothetical protein